MFHRLSIGTGGRPRASWLVSGHNADRVRSQLEGAFVLGQSAMMHGAITMKGGAVQQRNFHDYPLVRVPAAPRRIHVEVIPSEGPPGGVGEPGVPLVAPARARLRRHAASGPDPRATRASHVAAG